MLHDLLLILTLAGDGGVSLAVSPAETRAACEANRAQVEAILAGAGVAVLAARCGTSDLAFSPFYHGVAPEDETHRYRIALPDEGFVITPLAEGEGCEAAPKASPAILCARSAQNVEAP